MQTQLDHLNRFLAIYLSGKGWTEAANYAADLIGQGCCGSRRLQVWGKDFIRNRSALPYHHYTNSGCDSLLNNMKFAGELFAYIMNAGAHIPAQAIIDFMEKPEVVEHYHILKPVCLDMACRWMSKLNFKWGKLPAGMYIDGHEHSDMVHYCQNVYLPALAQYEQRM